MLASAHVGAWAFIGSAAPVAIWIAVRRGLSEGALPTSGTLLAVAWLITLACRLLHEWLQRVATPCSSRRGDLLLHGGLTLVSFLVAFAATFPAAPTLGVAALWALVVASEVAWWCRSPQTSIVAAPTAMKRGESGIKPSQMPMGRGPDIPSKAQSAGNDERSDEPTRVETIELFSPTSHAKELSAERTGPDEPLDESDDSEGVGETASDDSCDEVDEACESQATGEEEEEGASLLDPLVSQQWTRGVDESGGEWIEALVRVEFAAGQRNVATHLAFCPTLSSAPRVSATVVEGAPAELVVAESRGFGVRLELRRAESSAAFTDASVIHLRAEAASGRELPH